MATTVTRAIFHQLRFASAILFRSKKEFDIALGSGDRAFDDAENAPALRGDPVGRSGTDALVNVGIADDTTLPHFFAASLELRLDERYQPRAISRQFQRIFQNLGKRYEACVASYDIHGFRYHIAVEASSIRLFLDDDP